MLILGAGYTALGYGHIPQADVKRTAALSSVTNQALAGVVSQEQLGDGTAHLVYGLSIGVHHHALGNGGGTGGGKTAHLLNLDNAKATATVWF
ncbi:hypothetical protein ES703_112345 [subsurface metagenome]